MKFQSDESAMNAARIMICEDEALVAMELQRRVEDLGYAVCGVASDSQQAFELADREHPDLALMDVQLSGSLSGTEVADVLSRQYDIPSLYLTGHADAATIEKADATDPLGYLIKPVQDQELALSIRYGLAQDQAKKTLRRQLSEMRAKAERIIPTPNSPEGSPNEIYMQGLQEIIGGIAHHFNNSILSLSLPLELLLTCGTLKPFELRLVRRMTANFEAEKLFVRRLQWAAGEGGFTFATHSLTEIINQAIDKLGRTVSKNIEINTYLPEDPLSMLLDKEAISFALCNLLKNAVEAVGEQGIIIVEVKEVAGNHTTHSDERNVPEPFIEIRVSDSGPGIPQDVLPYVTRPFFTTHTERVATGLGLTEVLGIAQGHGGWFSIASASTKGTEARIVIPRGTDLDATAPGSRKGSRALKNAHRSAHPVGASTAPNLHGCDTDARQFGYL